jgi:AcrR family transcriptional regulator
MSANGAVKDDIFQEQVILAAQQLFQQYGLHKVTMDDVAKAVGKGRSSLYYYYKSKEEILGAVMDAEIREIISEIAQAMDGSDTAEQKIHAFCATKLKLSKKRKSLYNTMDVGMDANEMSNYIKAKHAIHKRYKKQENALFKQILTYGIEKGELRAMNPKDLDMLIFVLLSSLRGLKREMVIENDFSCMEKAVDALTSVIMNGLKK